MMFWRLCFFVCVIYDSRGESVDTENEGTYLKLKIEDGYIRGTKQKLSVDENKSVYAFRGIPYAKPPLGELRFEPPHRNDKWAGILNATTDKTQCVQGLPAEGSEDCLHINVYTPKLDGSLPVLVWIYGGAFIAGNASYERYRPDPLLAGLDIIVVSFDYRVGVFGFISTGDKVAPGNVGLKDQCLALKWVQRNIKYFGGDPKKVTIFGESAGAASVSYQLQSRCSKGLYRGAIMQSGNSLCLWALTRNASYIAYEIGLGLHIATTNSTKLMRDLKKVPYEDLQKVAYLTGIGAVVPNPLGGLMFSPVIEPPHENAFFDKYSDLALLEGNFERVPVIIGINSMEAAVSDDIPALIQAYFGIYDLNVQALAPADLTKDSLQRNAAAIAIRIRYFGLLPIAIQENAIVKFISDDQFNRPTRRTVINMSKFVPVYFYQFSYKGRLGAGALTKQGVGHTEDVRYLFSHPNESNSSSDLLTRSRLVKLWTNFAKHGNPTPESDPLLQNIEWKTAGKNPDNITFLDINSNLKLSYNPFEKNMHFYDTVYEDRGSPPYNTY